MPVIRGQSARVPAIRPGPNNRTNMKTLRIKNQALTASQYLDKCQHARNVRANRRSDALCAVYCFTVKAIALTLACVALGGIIQIVCLFAK